jgi:hypothetical protein
VVGFIEANREVTVEIIKSLGILIAGSLLLLLVAILSWIFVPILLWELYFSLCRNKDRHRWVVLVGSAVSTPVCISFWSGIYLAFHGNFEVVFVALLLTFMFNMFFSEVWEIHLLSKPCSL